MLMRFDPFQELDRTVGRNAPDRERGAHDLFGWSPFPSLFRDDWFGSTPLADVEETDDAYVVEVELPGMKQDDIGVEMHGRTLTVSAERKEKERVGILRRRTRVTGQFRYQVTLPAVDADAHVDASYDDGVLTIRVAKPEGLRPRRIALSQRSVSEHDAPDSNASGSSASDSNVPVS